MVLLLWNLWSLPGDEGFGREDLVVVEGLVVVGDLVLFYRAPLASFLLLRLLQGGYRDLSDDHLWFLLELESRDLFLEEVV